MQCAQEKTECLKCGSFYLRKHRICHGGTCRKCGVTTKNLIKHECVIKQPEDSKYLDSVIETDDKIFLEYQLQTGISQCYICGTKGEESEEVDFFPINFRNYDQIKEYKTVKSFDANHFNGKLFYLSCSKCRPLFQTLHYQLAQLPGCYIQRIYTAIIERAKSRFSVNVVPAPKQTVEVEVAEKPVEVAEKPVEVAEKPIEVAEKPVEVAEKPVEVAEQTQEQPQSNNKRKHVNSEEIEQYHKEETKEEKTEHKGKMQLHFADTPMKAQKTSKPICKHNTVCYYEVSYWLPDHTNQIVFKSKQFPTYSEVLIALKKHSVPMAAINFMKHVNLICTLCNESRGRLIIKGH